MRLVTTVDDRPSGTQAASGAPDIKPRSREVTDGVTRAPARAMLRAVGMGDDGIGAQSLVGRRTVAWDELAGIRVGRRSDLWLVTTRGTELRLPVLRARDLPRLSALSGGRIDVPAPPAD